MPDPQDKVDISWLPRAPSEEAEHRRRNSGHPSTPTPRPWLGILFNCCHVYGRIYKSPDGSRYAGRCPRCAVEVSAKVGLGGTSRRFFETN
ncbi:MAG: hypothetical protein EA380_09380 [Phycisphaeraceae bacterium]|nr:MAG: hypothetical protein EA380_09380 [Phycisphaeraceae bacterium]